MDSDDEFGAALATSDARHSNPIIGVTRSHDEIDDGADASTSDSESLSGRRPSPYTPAERGASNVHNTEELQAETGMWTIQGGRDLLEKYELPPEAVVVMDDFLKVQ